MVLFCMLFIAKKELVRYNSHRRGGEQMKSIFILLTHSNTCISKAIKLATNDT